jgi:hypothetical protein
VKAALEWITEVLSAVAGQMQDRGRPYALEHLLTVGCLDDLGIWRDKTLNFVRFLRSHRQGRSLKRTVHGHDERPCLRATKWLDRLLSVKKRCDGRRVRRHEVIRAARLIVAGIDAGGMKGKLHEGTGRTQN